MTRFFTRLMALLLAASVFVISAVLVAQLRPESLAGWGVMAFAIFAVFVSPWMVYRAVMRQVRPPSYPNEGEGAGLAMGAGIDSARRRDGDADGFDFD